ncbi:MAG: hypothetical protein WCK47_07215 [bacterium]|nr:hypothetical protein [Candidatus Sumerlaeota bacterium]
MKVALEQGDKMSVSIVENDKIVGTLTITFDKVASVKAVKAAVAETAAPEKTKKKRSVSKEAREKMRQAQLRRWEKIRDQIG